MISNGCFSTKLTFIFYKISSLRSLIPLGKTSQQLDDFKIADSKNIEYLLDAYGTAILRLAYSYLHQMSDAEDVLQDTLIRYLKVHPHFENPTHEKAWLMRVAINISKNKILYNKRRETVALDEDLFLDEEQDLKFVWDAVKSLPAKYSEVIHLFYQEGYSTMEIAKILSKKESTIRSLLHRGRSILKEVLKERYDFNE